MWKEEFTNAMSEFAKNDQLALTRVVYDDDQRPSTMFSQLTLVIIRERLLISIAALTVFSVAAFVLMSKHRLSWSWAGLGIVGVTCAGLASGACFGGLFYCGFEFTTVLSAIPFLALGEFCLQKYRACQ